MLARYLVLILFVSSYSETTQGKAMNTIHFENSTTEKSTIVGNDTSKLTSTLLDVIKSVPTWAWIVVGVSAVLVLWGCLACPRATCGVLCCPLCCALQLILMPITCCLSCLGFGEVGPRAGSIASSFQSCCYGGHTPAGSCFSNLQSYSMS